MTILEFCAIVRLLIAAMSVFIQYRTLILNESQSVRNVTLSDSSAQTCDTSNLEAIVVRDSSVVDHGDTCTFQIDPHGLSVKSLPGDIHQHISEQTTNCCRSFSESDRMSMLSVKTCP